MKTRFIIGRACIEKQRDRFLHSHIMITSGSVQEIIVSNEACMQDFCQVV